MIIGEKKISEKNMSVSWNWLFTLKRENYSLEEVITPCIFVQVLTTDESVLIAAQLDKILPALRRLATSKLNEEQVHELCGFLDELTEWVCVFYVSELVDISVFLKHICIFDDIIADWLLYVSKIQMYWQNISHLFYLTRIYS